MINKNLSKFIILSFTMLTALFLLTACGAASYMDGGAPASDYYDSAPRDTVVMEEAYQAEMEEKGLNGNLVESAVRHVIRTGSIDLAVDDTRQTMREIREMVSDLEGIVSYSYVYEMREGQYGGHMTLRVPEKRFEHLMAQLETYGKATNVQTGSDDVTMQYIDLEARLKNQKAQEERLIEILDMAETVEEVLEVEKELYRIRGEIESMTTQLMYLSDQVTFSTINVNLREETIPTSGISPGVFDNFGKRIQEAFTGSINFVLRAVSIIILALIALLPVLILLGLFILAIVLIVKKAKKRKKPKIDETHEITAKEESQE